MGLKTLMKSTKEKWYAGCKDIIRMGPYYTQIEAWKSLVLTNKEQDKQGSIHPENPRVWIEQ